MGRNLVLLALGLQVIGTYITSPWFPYASWVLHTAESVDYLSVITLMLAVAGLSIGKDLPMLRQIGWKILPVGFVVIAAQADAGDCRHRRSTLATGYRHAVIHGVAHAFLVRLPPVIFSQAPLGR